MYYFPPNTCWWHWPVLDPVLQRLAGSHNNNISAWPHSLSRGSHIDCCLRFQKRVFFVSWKTFSSVITTGERSVDIFSYWFSSQRQIIPVLLVRASQSHFIGSSEFRKNSLNIEEPSVWPITKCTCLVTNNLGNFLESQVSITHCILDSESMKHERS